MRRIVARLLSPTPPLVLVQIAAVAYFALWGCFNTAAPTMRPVAPFTEGRDTQIGVGLTGTASFLNAGMGSTAYVSRRFGPHLELGGYGEMGAVLPGVLFAAVPVGGTGSSLPFGGVLGGGGAARLRLDLFDILSIGLEAQLGAAGTVVTLAQGSPTSNFLLLKSYAGLPIAIRTFDWLTFYTDPGVGVLGFLPLGGDVAAVGVLPPLPQIRLPLGAMFNVGPRYHVLVETGIEGIPLVTSGPYLTVGGAADF